MADAVRNENIKKANALIEEGNEYVKAAKLNDAIEKYTQAIKQHLDPMYFCYRAAAYICLQQHDLAYQDFLSVLELDENEAKLYGRMGFAMTLHNRDDEVIELYTKALELDPNNDSYKRNLAIAEEKVREAANHTNNPFAEIEDLLGDGDIPGLDMNNPEMLQAAMQMMNDDPIMQNVMESAGGDLNNLLTMIQQMQQANPDLVEQICEQLVGAAGEEDQESNQSNSDNNNH